VVDGRPQARLHSCEGRSPSLDLCRFVGSGLLVHRVEVWRCAQRDPVFANDVRDVEQAGTIQDFIVRYEVVPSDVQDASLAPYMERI